MEHANEIPVTKTPGARTWLYVVGGLTATALLGSVLVFFTHNEPQRPIAPRMPQSEVAEAQVRTAISALGTQVLDLHTVIRRLEAQVAALVQRVETETVARETQEAPDEPKTAPLEPKTNRKATKKTRAQPEPEPKASRVRESGIPEDWEVIGFSGTRVVIATDAGSHVARIGQRIDGITILDIDADAGIIKTSHGELRYH